ncbi:Na(+)-translocating NADH-quinone reductase subunit F [Candidatus Entotheonellaceae bacterium PAL068K]
MTDTIQTRSSPWQARSQSRAAWLRQLRLGSGLVLMAYLTTHLANHALGLMSLSAMETGRDWFLVIWRHPVGTVVLYGSLVMHVALALWSLYQRRRLRMSLSESLQWCSGLLLPPLLIAHVVGTRLAHEWFGVIDSYTYVVVSLWHERPDIGRLQAIVLLLAWVHGSMGLHFWLRLKPWYARLVPVCFGLALLLPVLALLGFVQAGREVSRFAREPGWLEAVLEAAEAPDNRARQRLNQVRQVIPITFGVAVGLTLAARVVRRQVERRRGLIQITYAEGQQITVPEGISVLEASRLFGIPHASVCGGQGRCSTCRVRITQGRHTLPPASPAERRVLERVGAPPSMRLACQLRPVDNLGVIPVLPPSSQASAGFASPGYVAGQEQEIAVLFADLRGFTRLAEPKLPYDVVFFLNQYFEAIGEAIKGAGGIPNQFTGDGVMALFGVGRGPAEGCQQALLAAIAMVERLARLSQTLADELPEPLQIGIGIHTGPAVVGRMGYAETTYLTAVGDTVHVAARLEALTKEYHCQLVISEPVAVQASIDISGYPRHQLTVRNRTEPLVICVIDQVQRVARGLQAGPVCSDRRGTVTA